jgi:hypothetical protein
MVLEAFSVSYGKASAYLPVIDLLRNYFRIAGEDDERTRREKVTGRVVTLDRSLEDTLPYLLSLLGIVEGDDPLEQMDGQIKKRRTLEAIKRIILRASLNQPLMVIFEDLHWIDEQTQELLNLLADSIGTAKILLLVNYRPEYSHPWNSKTYYTQLHLDPLGKESAEEMLSALLGDGKDLIPLKRLIIERTEGTPFFMEEIVQALFEDGVLQRDSYHPDPLPEGPEGEGSKGTYRKCEAFQIDERGEGPRHGAGRARLADRPAFGGGEGVAADPGGAGARISARPGATRDAQAGGRAGAHALAAAGRGVHLRAAGRERS